MQPHNSKPESPPSSELRRQIAIRGKRPATNVGSRPQSIPLLADSGATVADSLTQQDGPLPIVNDRPVLSSNPFAWQLEKNLDHRGPVIPFRGYRWFVENANENMDSTERSQRILENCHWNRGDIERHFPLIEIMEAVPVSGFEGKHNSRYGYDPRRNTIRNTMSCRSRPPAMDHRRLPLHDHQRPRPPAMNHQRLPLHENRTNIPQPEQQTQPQMQPPISNEATRHLKLHQSSELDHQVLCFRPTPLFCWALKTKINPSSPPLHRPPISPEHPTIHPMEPPDRYYPLGEQVYYVWKDGICEIAKAHGDIHVKWTPGKPIISLSPLINNLLRSASAEIYRRVRRRTRYTSMISDVPLVMHSLHRLEGEAEDAVEPLFWV